MTDFSFMGVFIFCLVIKNRTHIISERETFRKILFFHFGFNLIDFDWSFYYLFFPILLIDFLFFVFSFKFRQKQFFKIFNKKMGFFKHFFFDEFSFWILFHYYSCHLSKKDFLANNNNNNGRSVGRCHWKVINKSSSLITVK